MASLRVDPEQRFSCSQCGKCCHRWEVVVSDAEVELYRHRNAGAWVDGGGDPFERLPGQSHLHTIRKQPDGACVFLGADNRCRIHVELGASRKPLTCRLFPYSFHQSHDGVVVTASFSCPTVVANQGALVSTGDSLIALESLRKEWGATSRPRALHLVEGRSIDARSARLLRDNLLKMLQRDDRDVRAGIRRIAAALDDLTRSRVVALGNDEFAEYLSLTLPHAAAKTEAPAPREPGAIARLMQYGFLYAVMAVRASLEYPPPSRSQLRARRLRLLAHFHGLAPGDARADVKAMARRRVDINADAIRPIVRHYLRSTIETLGAHDRPLIDELAIAVSCLNASIALAAMQADAAGRDVDRDIFIDAVTEAASFTHATGHGVLDLAMRRFAAGTDALWKLAS